MNLQINSSLVACLIVGAACGLESWLSGRNLAIATHLTATCLGYTAMATSDAPVMAGFGFGLTPMYALSLSLLACAWIAESDSLRSNEDVETRGDASNHAVAFVIGFSGAMGSIFVLLCAVAVMFAMFMRRARAGCEPIYDGASISISDEG